ncbi:hypothetical protein D3C75_1168370 [compost metagenome]
MSHFTQIFNTVAFCRHRVCIRIINPAGNFDFGRLDFKALALTKRFNHFTGDNNGATGCQAQYIFIVIRQRIINDGLYRREAGTVIDGEE